jgi:hypothetical protein
MDSLHKVLWKRRKAICQKWLINILNNSFPNINTLVKKQNDQFTNPVAYILLKELSLLFEKIILETDIEGTRGPLENILRIMTVQKLTPAQTINFIFLLKYALQNELNELNYTSQEWISLSRDIDNCVLLAINIYCNFRDTIHNLTIKEIKSQKDKVTLILERIRTAIPDDDL